MTGAATKWNAHRNALHVRQLSIATLGVRRKTGSATSLSVRTIVHHRESDSVASKVNFSVDALKTACVDREYQNSYPFPIMTQLAFM